MGHQLWISPITGYRRKGTRLSELRKLLGDGITTLAILEPIQSCPSNALANEMAQVLSERDFDIAGVQVTADGPVIGFVQKESLKGGIVKDHLKRLTAECLVSDSTPLATLLRVLKDREHAFVLIGPEVRGIVTRADLNKPPVRVYLFGLISLLEMHLSFWIREKHGENWQQALSPSRLAKAQELQEQRRARNEQVPLVDCLQFCDKRDLLIREAEVRENLGLGTKGGAKALLERAENLRDLLAHSQYDIRGTDWTDLISLVEWIEGVVHDSDQLVEEKAKLKAAEFQNQLFATA